jgi:hypothetical protein
MAPGDAGAAEAATMLDTSCALHALSAEERAAYAAVERRFGACGLERITVGPNHSYGASATATPSGFVMLMSPDTPVNGDAAAAGGGGAFPYAARLFEHRFALRLPPAAIDALGGEAALAAEFGTFAATYFGDGGGASPPLATATAGTGIEPAWRAQLLFGSQFVGVYRTREATNKRIEDSDEPTLRTSYYIAGTMGASHTQYEFSRSLAELGADGRTVRALMASDEYKYARTQSHRAVCRLLGAAVCALKLAPHFSGRLTTDTTPHNVNNARAGATSDVLLAPDIDNETNLFQAVHAADGREHVAYAAGMTRVAAGGTGGTGARDVLYGKTMRDGFTWLHLEPSADARAGAAFVPTGTGRAAATDAAVYRRLDSATNACLERMGLSLAAGWRHDNMKPIVVYTSTGLAAGLSGGG